MAYYLTINAVHLWKKRTRKNCTDRSIWKLIVVLFSSSRSVVTKTDVSSVGIWLRQSNSDSNTPTPTVQSILSFIDASWNACTCWSAHEGHLEVRHRSTSSEYLAGSWTSTMVQVGPIYLNLADTTDNSTYQKHKARSSWIVCNCPP